MNKKSQIYDTHTQMSKQHGLSTIAGSRDKKKKKKKKKGRQKKKKKEKKRGNNYYYYFC